MLNGSSKRPAFTLAEVLVSIALVAILTAIVIPTVQGRLQDGYEDAIVQEFDNISSAVIAYRQDVGKFPPQLRYLSALPTSPTDACGNALTTTQQNNWHGPYITRTIPAVTGYVIAQKDTVFNVLNTSYSTTAITVELHGADTLTAHDVDLKIDGQAINNVGGLQGAVNGTATIIYFLIPRKSGAC
jgi:prepilin-type N-terminal cleavage/methylation domain-containing protein